MTLGITLAQARDLIARTLEAARAGRMEPLTVVVLDAGGHLTAAQREDGSSAKRFEIARAKAHGAIAMGWGSRTTMERAEEFSPFFIAVGQVAGPIVPAPGGVLIRGTDGTMLGAVGVSGDSSDNDELAALEGIAAVGLIAQPD